MKKFYIKNIEEFVGIIAWYENQVDTNKKIGVPYIFKHSISKDNNLILRLGYFMDEENVASTDVEMVGALQYKFELANIPIKLSPKVISSIKKREWLAFLNFEDKE